VIVTASILALEHYAPVVEALNILATRRAQGRGIGPIYFIACENTLSAPAVFADWGMSPSICHEAAKHVTCVHALVDRMCVGLEEVPTDEGSAVLVRAEDYGAVKLQLEPENASLVELCRGSAVEFSRHVDTEKQIKSWLLNGTHWLIALEAFEGSRGDQKMKLNEFIASDPRHMAFARTAMREMKEGVAVLLRSQERFRPFVDEVDVDRYLDEAANGILDRFCSTEDPITRILARFRAPTPDSVDTIVSFSKRFADRVDEPIQAYEAKRGVLPPAASRGVLSLMRLVANGTFITAAAA
jgi:mannitol-1-phosphate/altronate dehydrogenase